MSDFKLSAKADSDLLEIARFTINKFGIPQARLYKNVLYDCFTALVKNTDLGRNAPEYAPHLRKCVLKSHTFFYRPLTTGILIVKVLHQNMDFDRHF